MPVWARAIETKKENSVLTDPIAVDIINSIDYDFSQMAKNLKEINLIAWIARCKRYDLVIKDFLKRNPEGTIINIGCGLDTTYERVDNKKVIWYDIDLPDVIELRKKFLKETNNNKFIASSFLDPIWFNKIPTHNKILIISAGVFVYFEESEIKSFILNLANKFKEAELLFDVTSPTGVKIANKVIMDSGLDNNTYFKWGLTNKSIIEGWDPRIKILNTYFTFKIKGIKLSLKNRIMGFLSDAAFVQYMIHLEITHNCYRQA